MSVPADHMSTAGPYFFSPSKSSGGRYLQQAQRASDASCFSSPGERAAAGASMCLTSSGGGSRRGRSAWVGARPCDGEGRRRDDPHQSVMTLLVSGFASSLM